MRFQPFIQKPDETATAYTWLGNVFSCDRRPDRILSRSNGGSEKSHLWTALVHNFEKAICIALQKCCRWTGLSLPLPIGAP